jgi:hypothetical protein
MTALELCFHLAAGMVGGAQMKRDIGNGGGWALGGRGWRCRVGR